VLTFAIDRFCCIAAAQNPGLNDCRGLRPFVNGEFVPMLKQGSFE